jgi:hypothetical protein
MDKFTVWTNEFFNRSVRTVYDVAGPSPGALPETPVRIDARTGRIPGIAEPYVLTTRALQLDEKEVAADDARGLALYRVVRPLGVKSATRGFYPDLWSGPTATYTRFRCHTGQTLYATVAGDTRLIQSASTVTVDGTHLRVLPSIKRTLIIPLHADGSRCVVHFQISPVAVPATLQPGSTDTRVLGLRFLDFTVR